MKWQIIKHNVKQVLNLLSFLLLLTGIVVLGSWITANIYRETLTSADELTPSKRRE